MLGTNLPGGKVSVVNAALTGYIIKSCFPFSFQGWLDNIHVHVGSCDHLFVFFPLSSKNTSPDLLQDEDHKKSAFTSTVSITYEIQMI